MASTHPVWCRGDEPADQHEHVSPTLHAAAWDDVIDIRLRLSQPGDEKHLTTLELEFVDNDEVAAFPLDLRQARRLQDAMCRLLS